MSLIRLLPPRPTLATGVFTAAANPTNAQATGVLTFAANSTRANAFGTLTLAGNPLDTETVTIDAKVYTFQTVLTDVDGNVLIGATASDTIDNLIAAITLGAGAGTLYATSTTLHPTVTAAAGAGDTMVATAKADGVAGNSIGTTEAATDVSWGGATLADGAVAETVTIGSTVYTFVNVLGAAFDVLIGATASDTLDNLIAAINLAAGAGTLYGTGTTAHSSVSAAAGTGDTVDLTADARGTGGNSIATAETGANSSFGAATLTGGTTETVTIGSFVYTWKESDNLTDAYDVLIGASASDSLDNLIAAINLSGTDDVEYAAGTEVNTFVTAAAGTGDTMDVTAKPAHEGPAGALVATTETGANTSWGAATLVGAGSTTVAAPTLTSAAAGVSIGHCCDQAQILVRSVLGSGTMTASPILWGYNPQAGFWYKLGALNAGSAIGETTSDHINYAELVVGLRGFTRLAVELTVAGTATEVEVQANCVIAEPVSR